MRTSRMRYTIDRWGVSHYLNPITAHFGGYGLEDVFNRSYLVPTDDLPDDAVLGVDSAGCICLPADVISALGTEGEAWSLLELQGRAIEHYNKHH